MAKSLQYEDRLKLAERLEQQMRLPDIAEELDISYQTVYSEVVRGGGAYNRELRKYIGYDPEVGQTAGQRGKYRKYLLR